MKKITLRPYCLPADDLFGYGGEAEGKSNANCHPVNLDKGYHYLKSTRSASIGKRIDPDIQALFGICHIFGWGVESNSVDSIGDLLSLTRTFADKRHPLSCFFMGCYYLHKSRNGEKGNNKELKEANEYFNIAMKFFEENSTNPTVAVFLALCYEEGYGKNFLGHKNKPNIEAARSLYEYSALCHNAFAKYKLGLLLLKTSQHKDAYHWLNEASKQNWLAANVPLSKYEKERGNVERADILIRNAIEKNDSQALLEVSLMKMSIMSSEELNQQEKLFQVIGSLATQETNPLASFHYGCMLQDRNQDELAVEHYKNATKHGLMHAEYNLALCYHKGLGTKQNYDEAYKYFKYAADKHHPYSLYALGWYDECEGSALKKHDPRRKALFSAALERYKKAAQHSDKLLQNYSYFAIARIYSEVYKDYDNAIQYFDKAAKQRDRDAMRELGRCLMHNVKIESENFEKAAQWLKTATELGDRAAYNLFFHDCWPMLAKLNPRFKQSFLYASLSVWQNTIKLHIARVDELNHVEDIIHNKTKPIADKTLQLDLSMPLPRLTKEAVLKEIYSIDRTKLTVYYDRPPLGRGGFGIVYSGVYETMDIAVKALNLERIKNAIERKYFTEEERTRELDSVIDSFSREVNRMLYLNHRNVIRTYGFVDDLTSMLIVMPKMEGGSLQKYINEKVIFSPIENLRIALEISAGLNYLHNQDILHNDMKADNVLFSKNTPVICDFGLSSYIRESVIGGGTINWNGPECFEGAQERPRSIQSDIYSLALVIWSLFSNESPYVVNDRLLENLEEEIVKKRTLPTIPASVPDQLKTILLLCWSYDPVDRPASVNNIIAVIQSIQTLDVTNSHDRSYCSSSASTSQVAARNGSPLYHNPFDENDEEDLAYREHNMGI